MAKTVVVAACGLIDPDGRVLIAQRPPGKAMAGLWEFPGGKVEADETPEQALIRKREWSLPRLRVFVREYDQLRERLSMVRIDASQAPERVRDAILRAAGLDL